MQPLTRRRFLGLVGITATSGLAGCAALVPGCTREAILELEPATDEVVEERVVPPLGPVDDIDHDLAEAAHREGTVTLGALHEPPLPDGRYIGLDGGYVELDGRYYEPTVDVVKETETRGYRFDVETDESIDDRARSGSSISLHDLSDDDRRAFLDALSFPPLERLGSTRDWSVDGAAIAFADPDAEEASVLVPEPEYDHVEYGGNQFRLEPAGTETVTLDVYEIRLELVAHSRSALADLAVEEFGVDLDGWDLTVRQRKLLEGAVVDAYSECHAYSAGFDRVRALLEDAEFARFYGSWYRVHQYETVAN